MNGRKKKVNINLDTRLIEALAAYKRQTRISHTDQVELALLAFYKDARRRGVKGIPALSPAASERRST